MDSLCLARGSSAEGFGGCLGPEEQQQQDGPLLASISRAVVQIVHEYTGRGPTKARTSIRDDVVVVMLQEALLKAERSLIDDGNERQVVDIRRTFSADHARRPLRCCQRPHRPRGDRVQERQQPGLGLLS
jgi:hypothetical protein